MNGRMSDCVRLYRSVRALYIACRNPALIGRSCQLQLTPTIGQFGSTSSTSSSYNGPSTVCYEFGRFVSFRLHR